MTRRAPAQFEPPPIDFDYAPFDEDALRRILVRARVPAGPIGVDLASACERLNDAAILLKVHQGMREAPTGAPERKAIERILKLASALRGELPLVADSGLYEAESGVVDTPRVVDGITRLFTPAMTRLMRARVSTAKDGQGNGPEADEIFGARNAADAFLVLTELLDLLVAAGESELKRRADLSSDKKAASPVKDFVRAAGLVYRRLTGEARLPLSRKPPRGRSDDGELQGPLISFLGGCCRHLSQTVKRETLAGWVREIREETGPARHLCSGINGRI